MPEPGLTRERRHPRAPSLNAPALDALVVVGLLALYVVQTATTTAQPVPGQHHDGVVSAGLTVLMALPFLTHRRWPITSAAVSLGALVGYAVGDWQSYPGVNAFVLIFGVAAHCHLRRSLPVFVAATGALLFALLTQPEGVVTTSTVVSTALLASVAQLAGRNLRHRRARWAALSERALFLEHEREDRTHRAVVEERLRIARELHDVVAHSMSVIAVQSGVGHHVLDAQPEEARRALAAIETTSRASLVEMRRLLGVLRQEGESNASLAPAPGLADLPALVEQVRNAGVDVLVETDGSPGSSSLPLDLTAYRIVQEALTNVIKHGGRTARVRIGHGDRELAIEVVDDGRDVEPRQPTPPSEGQRSEGQRSDGQRSDGQRSEGHGLVGMQERVAVFDGAMSAGPLAGGGFRLTVRLPITAGSR